MTSPMNKIIATLPLIALTLLTGCGGTAPAATENQLSKSSEAPQEAQTSQVDPKYVASITTLPYVAAQLSYNRSTNTVEVVQWFDCAQRELPSQPKHAFLVKQHRVLGLLPIEKDSSLLGTLKPSAVRGQDCSGTSRSWQPTNIQPSQLYITLQDNEPSQLVLISPDTEEVRLDLSCKNNLCTAEL